MYNGCKNYIREGDRADNAWECGDASEAEPTEEQAKACLQMLYLSDRSTRRDGSAG